MFLVASYELFYICDIRCNVSLFKKKNHNFVELQNRTPDFPPQSWFLIKPSSPTQIFKQKSESHSRFFLLPCSRHAKHQPAFLTLYYCHSIHFLPLDCHHLSLSTTVISCLDYCNSLQTGLLLFPLAPLNLPPQHKGSLKKKPKVRLFPFLIKVFSLFLKSEFVAMIHIRYHGFSTGHPC